MEKSSLLLCIDDFRLSDLDDVLRIVNVSFTVDAFKTSDFIELHDSSENTFLVARTKLGAIVGYVVSGVENREGCIISIAIDPRCRGRGLGELLVESIILRVIDKDAETLRLHVNVANKPAIYLYEKLGFVIEQLISEYYSDSSSAYLMRLSL